MPENWNYDLYMLQEESGTPYAAMRLHINWTCNLLKFVEWQQIIIYTASISIVNPVGQQMIFTSTVDAEVSI